MLDFILLKAGYCTQHAHFVLPDGPKGECRFPALVGVFVHPERGLVLFDTGYSQAFYEATARYPERLYLKATPVYFQESESAANQLRARGFDPQDVSLVLLSHFHADHVGGAKDFPKARFVYHQAAYERLRAMPRLWALRHAFLPSLLPGDFEARSRIAESLPERAISLGPFGLGRDLLGDGSLILVDLPGHALGHFGLLAETRRGPVFLVADACWASRGFREYVLPAAIAQVLFSDRASYRDTFIRLHTLHKAMPDLPIIPSHCEEAFERHR